MWAAIVCAVGVLSVLTSVWLLLGPVAAAERDEAAYRAAQACPADPMQQANGCISRRDTTVTGTREKSRKGGSKYWVEIPGREVRTDSIRITHTYSFTKHVHKGDRITLFSWRGEIREVAVDGVRYRTGDSPLQSWAPALGWATGLFPAGITAVLGGLWWLARGSRSARSNPWQTNVIVLDGLLTAVFVGVWASDDGLGPTTVEGGLLVAGVSYAAATLIALCCWSCFAREERRQSDTIAITPRPGPAEQIIDVFLPHEADYSGKDHLVVEPGVLAMSPDPTGRVARRALPDDLTLVRGRHQQRTDGRHLSGGRYSGPYYVAECRAGGRTLLFYGKKPALERLAGTLAPCRPAPQPPVGTAHV